MHNGKQRYCAFSLVELLVVLSIIALLLTIVSPKYFKDIDQAKETTLKKDLQIMRESLDKYYGDHQYYQESLERLVEEQYIRSLPIDPITERADTWLAIEAEPPLNGIADIKSGAEGVARDGSLYGDW